MLSGLFPDEQYSIQSLFLFNPSFLTYSRASSNGSSCPLVRYFACFPPTQSVAPFHSSLYVPSGRLGRKSGNLSDFVNAIQSLFLFNPSFLTYSRASSKDRNFLSRKIISV